MRRITKISLLSIFTMGYGLSVIDHKLGLMIACNFLVVGIGAWGVVDKKDQKICKKCKEERLGLSKGACTLCNLPR